MSADASHTAVELPLLTATSAVQIAHTDVTLDDVWTLDLAKLDGWHCLAANSAGGAPVTGCACRPCCSSTIAGLRGIQCLVQRGHVRSKVVMSGAGEDVFEPEPGWETDEDASADEGEQSDE